MNCRSMNFGAMVIFLVFVRFCESASVYKEDATLELIHNDVSKINNAIEEISFEILKKILDDPMESEESTTLPPTSEHTRIVRSVEDDIKGLCRKQCVRETQQNQTLEAKQIKELKLEVQKLQDLVKVLQEQQKIISDLDEKPENSTHVKETRSDKELEENHLPKHQIDENIPNSEQLSIMKANLKKVIQSLNQTREFINLQNQKDKILEDELIKQKQELDALKTAVNSIINQSTSEARSREAQSAARSSEDASELKKLLSKVLPDEDNSSDDSISHAKILAFAEALKKLKKEDHVKKEKANDSNLMKLLLAELKKSQSKSDDIDVEKLKNLQDEINKASPKESVNFAQFQAILDKLITTQSTTNANSQLSLTPQQMSELTKKIVSFGGNHNTGENYILNPVSSSASHPNLTPYICVVDNGYGFPAIPRNNYQSGPTLPPPVPQRIYNPPPPTPSFFPGQYSTPSNYNQGNAYPAASDKQYGYPGENPATVQKYQDDLKLQINGLQTAIDSLNRPEYPQEPGDRETINNLEKQINDLKQVVDNLNYDPNYQPGGRSKRSMDNNKVDDSIETLKESPVQEIKKKKEENPIQKIELIQNKINKLRSQLNKKNDTFSNFRAAEEPNNYASAYDMPFNLFSELESSSNTKLKTAKNDVFVELIGNIMDKVLAAIPMILHKLFNFSLSQFTQYGYQEYDLQTVFKNMGVFGILPIILIRLIEGFSTFLKVLKKNSFFKNFIIPALILGVIAGGVLFLIWWLQPDDYDNYYHQYGNDYSVDGYPGGSTYTQNYGAQYQPNTSPTQTYSKNYYNSNYNK